MPSFMCYKHQWTLWNHSRAVPLNSLEQTSYCQRTASPGLSRSTAVLQWLIVHMLPRHSVELYKKMLLKVSSITIHLSLFVYVY